MSGKREGLYNLAALVSSVDELIHVVKLQTQEYNKNRHQQKQHYEQQKQSQWSSQHIASLLNVDSDEREQLEGLLGSGFYALLQMMSFDNRTLEQYASGEYLVTI